MKSYLILYTVIFLLITCSEAERDRTGCFNYIDCLEQAQRQFKGCAGGTAMALALERGSRLFPTLMQTRSHILLACQEKMRKEELDFDTLQTLVNEDSRECFEKMGDVIVEERQEPCEYPVQPLRTPAPASLECLVHFQQDRHRCELLLRCCPEHNACAERMNALSVAFQLARNKSREISEKMMQCVAEEDVNEREERKKEEKEEEKPLREVEEDKEEEETIEGAETIKEFKKIEKEVSLERAKKEATQTVFTPNPTHFWTPAKIAKLNRELTEKAGGERVEEEETTAGPVEEETTEGTGRPAKLLVDGGLPFGRPDKAMKERIRKRLQLTPSALLDKNRDAFMKNFDRLRKQMEHAESENRDETEEEEDEEEISGERKVAIVKFLLENADIATTEKIVTMLTAGDIKGLMEMEKEEKQRRFISGKAVIHALPAEEESAENEELPRREAKLDQAIQKTLERVSSDHKEQKMILMKNIKTALADQKHSMAKMAHALAQSVSSRVEVSSPSTVVEAEEERLNRKEARLSEELAQRIGLEQQFQAVKEPLTTQLPPSTLSSSPPLHPTPPSTLSPSPPPSPSTLPSTTQPSTSPSTFSPSLPRLRRKSKNSTEDDYFCTAFSQCEAIVWEYQTRCDRKFNPITVTFGIEDGDLREMLLNNSKSDSSVVTQVCLRPVDKSVQNSVMQLQHIERGVRRACLSLGRSSPSLTEEGRRECSALAHFSVIEMEDWLATTHGHTQAKFAECQARTAGISASCSALSECCSATSPCSEYLSSSPVSKMRAEAIRLLLAQQDDCESRMERTLRSLNHHFRNIPLRH